MAYVDKLIATDRQDAERGTLCGVRIDLILMLAKELHDSKHYEQAEKWYRMAMDSIAEGSNEYSTCGVRRKWIAEQFEGCTRRQGRSHSPVWRGSHLEPVVGDAE